MTPAGISKAVCESYCVCSAWISKPDPEYCVGLQHILPSWTFSWYKPHERNQPVLIMSTVTQPGFLKSDDHIQNGFWKRERFQKMQLSNILPQCYHGHSGQRRCTCSPLCHVASFGFPQHRHHSKLHDFLFPASRTLRSKDKTS